MASVSRSSRAEFTWGLVLVGLGVLEAKVLQTNSPWAAPVALVIVGVLGALGRRSETYARA